MRPDLADFITLAIAVLVGVLSAAAVISWLYVERVYRLRLRDTSELTRLVRRDRRIAVGGAVIEAIVVYSCLAFVWPETFPPLPRPWGAALIGLVMALMLLGPIDDAIAWSRLRREVPDSDLWTEPDPTEDA